MRSRETIWLWALGAGTAAAALAAWSGLLPAALWLAPWALSLVLFGLPHGALDHVVLWRMWWPTAPPRWAIGAIPAGYLALSLLVIAGWFAAPVIVFAGFILLTWAHWGLADLWWSWRRDRTYFTSRWHRAIFAAWRGGLPMLAPLVFDPVFYRQTAVGVCVLFQRDPPSFRWLEHDATRLAALGILVALGLADSLLARGTSPRWRLNLAEGAGLLVFFSLLPALASVGLYFSFWHGLRHVRRLMVAQTMSGREFAWRAAPATIGALVMLSALALTMGHRLHGLEMVGVYLALIAALTVPHAIVVTLQDARDGLWRPQGGP